MNLIYTSSRFSREYSLYILFLIHDIFYHSLDTKIYWLHQRKRNVHDAWVSESMGNHLGKYCDNYCDNYWDNYWDNPIAATVYLGQSTVYVHWSIVPFRQISEFLRTAAFSCIFWVWRTYSKFASACASSSRLKSIINTRYSNLCSMIFFDIQS